MPVTARLSRKFYEQFGDDIANELVDWFNSVDETYRADLRELNEFNFARFEAKLEQRLAELSAELRVEFHGALDSSVAELRREMGDLKAGLMRWQFGLWATQMLALIGVMITIVLRTQ